MKILHICQYIYWILSLCPERFKQSSQDLLQCHSSFSGLVLSSWFVTSRLRRSFSLPCYVVTWEFHLVLVIPWPYSIEPLQGPAVRISLIVMEPNPIASLPVQGAHDRPNQIKLGSSSSLPAPLLLPHPYGLVRNVPKFWDLSSEQRNKGIGDAGSTADFRMLWSAMVCVGLL